MKKSTLVAMTLALALPGAGLATSAAAQDYRWHGGEAQNWDPAAHYTGGRGHHDRRLTRSDYVYRGHDGRYYCRRSDGSTGLVVGAIAGGVLGNALGNGGALGTLLGAAGGGAIGHSIDRGQVHCR